MVWEAKTVPRSDPKGHAAVCGALLSVVDVVKSVDRGVAIHDIRLLRKEGAAEESYGRSEHSSQFDGAILVRLGM